MGGERDCSLSAIPWGGTPSPSSGWGEEEPPARIGVLLSQDILKASVSFEQGTLHFHLALGPAS